MAAYSKLRINIKVLRIYCVKENMIRNKMGEVGSEKIDRAREDKEKANNRPTVSAEIIELFAHEIRDSRV